jgi:hypothetical protein
MTKQEAIEQFNAMPAGGDAEAEHGSADEILLRRLEDLGDVEVAQAFRNARERVGFWYA